jgi:hypothetical protein
MDASTLSSLQTFREQTVLPALSDIRDLLDEPHYNVTLASNTETGIDAVDHIVCCIKCILTKFNTKQGRKCTPVL